DRYLLGWLAGPDVLAVYGWAARIGGILNVLLVQSLQLAFLAIGLKTLYGADGRLRDSTLHPRVFRHFAALGGFASLGLSLITYDGTRLLSSEPAYLGASGLVLPIALGYVGYGLYFVVVNVLYAAGETRRISQGVVGAAVGNGVLNLALIPVLGAMGAALATVLAFAGLALYAERVARRHAAIQYPWGAALASGAVAALLAIAAGPSEAWGLGARVALRAGLLAAYPVALIALGLYQLREIREGAAQARAWFRGLRG
ncbi:MAG: polysaccharide biosynthesis C-terminal domain-containing protein, partial [Bacteroidota bacterium]